MKKKKRNYPSAVMLKEDCYNEYTRIIETYDSLYNKVNVALAFCVVVLIAITADADYTKVSMIFKTNDLYLCFYYCSYYVALTIALGCIISSVIRLLGLMRGRKVTVFDSIAVRNLEIYRSEEENAALWLIEKYTDAIFSLQRAVEEKQNKYDKAIMLVIIAIIAYAVTALMKKGI